MATAAAGLESLVARELRNMEVENVTIDDRSRVFFTGNTKTIAQANTWLRTADRVKIVVGEFKARTFDELFENVYALDWEDYLPQTDGYRRSQDLNKTWLIENCMTRWASPSFF